MPYNLGKNGEYKMSEDALNHIINGDISERLDKDIDGKTILTKIIAGGMHTFSAWNKFLSFRSDITHGLLVNSSQHEKWYYARELQNKIILLKIPRDCFQSKAANITKFPETYYKSGYLWKTLFPIKFTKEQIISTINDALNNIFDEESNETLIIGYANVDDLFKSIKIRIQVRGNEIFSAFPTWEQPMTGNNGKPFSHIDAINTIISASCVFSDNERIIYLNNTIRKWDAKTIQVFYDITPEILKNRKPPKKGKERKEQLLKRSEELKRFGESITEENLKTFYQLCITDEYIRHTLDFIRFLYDKSYKKINERLKVRNTASVFQNLQECLGILNAWDLKNNGRYAIKVINEILKVHFIRTGGLDQWETKRLSNLICNIILSYQNSEIIFDFLKMLSKSPTRIGFYCEFNLNPYFLPDPMLIGLTSNEDLALNDKHFYDFVSQNLGINYTMNFEDSYNTQLSRKLQITEHENGLKIVKDLISHSVGSDFNYFAMSLVELCKLMSINIDSIKIIESIIYDYYRCIATNIQRILAKHKGLLVRDLNFGDKDYTKYTKAKHEYKFLWILNKLMIEEISKLYKDNGFNDLAEKLENNYLSLYEEVMKIPMPKSVPKYNKDDEFL
jgi:hypothetical protein